MTRRLSLRAAVATVLGLALTVGGVLYVSNGLAQRYDAAHTAMTIRQGPPPTEVDEYTYYGFDSDGSVAVDDSLPRIVSEISGLLLRDAERNGTFTVPELTLYVRDTSLVAVAGEPPGFRGFGIGMYFRPWVPHAYMIPVFAGGIITFAGLFWMAARWHLTASAHRREIDETPL